MSPATSSSREPAGLAPQAFESLLRREAPPAVIVAAGPETWFRRRVVAALVAKSFPEGDPGAGIVRLDARSADDRSRIEAIDDELRGTSLFAEERLVVLEEPDAGAPPGPGKPLRSTALAKRVLAAPPPGARLVLVTERAVKGRGAVGTRALLTAGAWVVDCRRLYDGPAPWERGKNPCDHELARHLVARMKTAHQRVLSLELAHAMSQRVGNHLGRLEEVLRSLALGVPAERALAAEDVEAVCGVSREDPLWVVVEATLDGDVDRAVELIEHAYERGIHDERGHAVLQEQTIFLFLVRTLSNAFLKSFSAAEALDRGVPRADVLAASGVPSFAADAFLRRAARGAATFARLHHHLFQAETGVKNGRLPARLAGERLVAELATGLSASR